MDRDKHDCILLAAAKAFSHFGFKKASIDEIARDAGVGKGTIYLAARSKKDLFYQVLNREVRDWAASGARDIDPRAEVAEGLHQLLDREVRAIKGRPLVGRLLSGELHTILPTWLDRLDELRRVARSNVLELLRLGARRGELRKDLDLEEVAVLLQDLQVAALLFHSRGADHVDAMSHRWETAVSALIEGLAPRSREAAAVA